MKENKIRAMLNAGKSTVSFRMWTNDTYMIEALGDTGNFDYVEYLAEYSPFDQYDLHNMCIAAELHDMGTMIKVDFQNRGYVAQKAIASGFQAVLFADCLTAEDVRETLRLVAPRAPEDNGVFGYPNDRFIGYQPHLPQLEHAQRERDVVKAFMIEKASAVDQIEEICSIPGVDMVQFGPSDFSMSVGWNQKDHQKEVLEVEKHVIEVALKHGVEPRCEIRSLEPLQYYIDLGVRQFSFGDQLAQLNNFWNNEGSVMRKTADELARK